MIDEQAELPDSILESQRQSWLAGRPRSVPEILHGTAFQHNRDAVLDLLYNEIVIQEELGITPSIDEYLTQFPDYADDLKLHFEVHQALNDQLLQDTGNSRDGGTWPETVVRRSESELPSVPNYTVNRVLGQGGMSIVYHARDRRLHREVALKLFQSGHRLTHRESQRIRIEAESLARLTHPNIVQIYEIGDDHGTPYLALEYVSGGTLSQKLQQFPFTPSVAAELIETLAKAVQVAHDRQIVHRDLKPANILFTPEGTPKVTDFGLAKLAESQSSDLHELTQTGEAMGTPRYMSPEQAAGDVARIGPATDIYALGTLLYECVTGRAPFISSNVIETWNRIRNEDPIPPRRLQASMPRDLEIICLRCLEKEPVKRFSSARELAEELHRFRHGEPIRSRAAPAYEKAWKWCRKRPAQATWIALAVFLVTAGLMAMVLGQHFESRRVARLRVTVDQMIRDGQAALERDAPEAAFEHFQDAWLKVQGESSLQGYLTAVSGWLDHSRNAMNRETFLQRLPPRDFDDRRDEAILLSLFQVPVAGSPFRVARESVAAALELTVPGDRLWDQERKNLLILEIEIIRREQGPEAALQRLDALSLPVGRRVQQLRASILSQLGRGQDAEIERHALAKLPPEPETVEQFWIGIDQLRRQQFHAATETLEQLQAQHPESFTTRFFLSVSYLKLRRHAEARVALTACLAQRPRFDWNHYFLGQAHAQSREFDLAQRQFQAVLHERASDASRLAAVIQLIGCQISQRHFITGWKAVRQLVAEIQRDDSHAVP